MKKHPFHRDRRRRELATLAAFVGIAGAWLSACGSVAAPTSGSSSASGAGGGATTSSASDSSASAGGAPSGASSSSGDASSSDASSSGESSSSDSSSSAGSGLVFVGGGLATVSGTAPFNGGLELVDQGLETTARVCGGNYCVVGGLVP